MSHPSIPDLKSAAAIVARLVANKWIQDYINSMDENAQY